MYYQDPVNRLEDEEAGNYMKVKSASFDYAAIVSSIGQSLCK